MVMCFYPGCSFVSCCKSKKNRPGCTLVGSEDKLKWLCPTHNALESAPTRIQVSLFLQTFSNGKFTNQSMLSGNVQIILEEQWDALSNHLLFLRSVPKQGEFLHPTSKVI